MNYLCGGNSALIVISDCVRDNLDEGCIKVASTLSKRLVEKGAKLLAINTNCKYATRSIKANKIYSNNEIYDFISQYSGDVVYIPFASNTLGTAIRTWIICKKSKRKVSVLFALRWHMSLLTKFFFRLSGCKIYTISQDSYYFFNKELKGMDVKNLKIGVDTDKFVPVDSQKKRELRIKYGLPLDKIIVLHVGHLKHERNVDVFLQLDEMYHGLLVFSSVTKQNQELKEALLAKSNITIINDYCPNIEELYQMSDIYLFPVVEANNCIDVPLSVLEAASCNIKVVTSKYKELCFINRTDSFNKVDNVQLDNINKIIEEMGGIKEVSNRNIALEYDWKKALGTFGNV